MARVNVYLPDDLADAARDAGLDVSGMTQVALRKALAERDTNRWLDSIARMPPTKVTRQVGTRIKRLQSAPIQRHLLALLLKGAWRRRHDPRLVDAVYAQLADDLGVALVTTDAGLAIAAANGELIEAL